MSGVVATPEGSPRAERSLDDDGYHDDDGDDDASHELDLILDTAII